MFLGPLTVSIKPISIEVERC